MASWNNPQVVGNKKKKQELIACATLRIADVSTTAHLDKVEHGYENMDHFSVEFRKESRALCSIDFIQG